jgi:YVTN family beta-propeller protein
MAEIAVGAAPEGVGTTPGAVWVANHHDGTVSRIDPKASEVVATIQVGPSGRDGPLELAGGPAGVWVHVPSSGSVVHIDHATNLVAGSVLVDGAPATDGSDVWIADPANHAVIRVNPAGHSVIATIPLPGSTGAQSFGGIAAGLGSVWVSTSDGVYRIDASTNQVVGRLPADLGDLAVGAGSVWLAPYGKGVLLRIEPD